MKRLHQLLSLLVLLLLCAALPGQEFTGAEAEKKVPGAKMVLMGDQSEVPTFVVFQKDAHIPVADFEAWERETFGITRSSAFNGLKVKEDKNGGHHYLREQLYEGIVVRGAKSAYHVKDGMVEYFNGSIHAGIEVNPSPQLSLDVAIGEALKSLGINHQTWKQHLFLINYTLKDTALMRREAEASDLMIVPYKKDYRLSWVIQLVSERYDFNRTIGIDAHSGEIIFSENIHATCNAGTVNTTRRGFQNFTTDVFTGDVFNLEDDCGARDLQTLRDDNSPFTNIGNIWNPLNLTTRGAATAHWAAEHSYNAFENRFGRSGMDGSDGPIRVLVFPNQFQGAYQATWRPENISGEDEMWLGLQSNFNTNDDVTTLDIVGHEFTHGVAEYSGWVYSGLESTSLQEGVADILGNIVEYEFDNYATVDWRIGDGLGGFVVVDRRLNNPNIEGSPDTYLQPGFWSASINDRHDNGGVIRHWFFLLSEGGSGTNGNGDFFFVNGVGIQMASDILYEAIDNLGFAGIPDHAAARLATIQALDNLNIPICDQEDVENSVIDAWFAVGVGENIPADPLQPVDIAISNLNTNLPNNIAAPGETFTASFNLRGQPYENGTYVGFFLRSWCTSSVLYSPFEVDFEQVTCFTTTNHTTQVTLPQGLAPGQYTLIARSDVFNWVPETSTWNDRACRTITIQDNNPAPDLRPISCSNSPSTVQAGNTITTSVNLKNEGTAYAGSSTMGYYLSTNTTYDPGTDVYLGTRSYPGLNPGSTSFKTKSLTIPGNTSAGSYYILARADIYSQVDEGDNENNNVRAGFLTVTAPPANLPDLIITSVNPGPDFGSPPYVNKGTNLPISFNLVNQGSNPVANSTVKIYLSTSSTSPSNNNPVRTMYSQQPGNKSTTIYIPSNQPPGFWYILVRADANNNVTESVESNNYNYGFCQINFNFNKPAEGPGDVTTVTNASDSETGSSGTVVLENENSADVQFENTAAVELSIFPNPASNAFTLTYPIQETKEVSIALRSSKGQVLRTAQLAPGEQTGKWQQEISDLPPGVYLLSWESDDRRITRRLVIH